MLVDAITSDRRSMPDDHSPLAPRLPIPNRTVKRWRADDSTDSPCESRSLSGTFKVKRPAKSGPFCFGAYDPLYDGVAADAASKEKWDHFPPST